MNWTPQRVFDELPNIPVVFGDGTNSWAVLSRKSFKFAQLSVLVHGSWLYCEASYMTIAQCLNEDRRLRL